MFSAVAQNSRVSETPYAILDLTKNTSIKDSTFLAIKEVINTIRWGLKISLFEEDSQVFIQTKDSPISFVEFLDTLKNRLEKKECFYIPIVFSYKGDWKLLDSLLEESKLAEYIISKDVLEKDHPLRWFANEKKHIALLAESDSMNFGKYIIPFSRFVDTANNIETYFCSYLSTAFTNEADKLPFTSLKIGNESSYLGVVIEDWKSKGKFPVYFLVDEFNYSFRSLTRAIEDFPKINGNIDLKDSNIMNVYWKEFPSSVSLDKFCFPVENSATFSLTPYSPGFLFKPSEYKVDKISESELNFRPAVLKLDNGLKAFYKFDGSLSDETYLNHGIKNYGTEFYDDSQRGEVIEFSFGDFVQLPTVKSFNLYDNDFTISAWCYLTGENNYQSILCNTESTFRKGLQFAIRDNTPYAGFWHMDLKGDNEVEIRKWNHITCVYSKRLERMQIFLNGKLDVEAYDFLSFNGSVEESLFLGKHPNGFNFSGRLDDVIIWDRSLADFEVQQLYLEGF